MRICVVGLGKIGLPLAVQYASMGYEVIGCDINPDVVRSVNSGQATFGGEEGLEELLSEQVSAGRLSASTQVTAAVSASDAVVIVVPLLVDPSGAPDFTLIDLASKNVGKGLRHQTLVCYETTLPVGTTRSRFAPLLEKASGLVAGQDFFLAYSPERVYSGRIFHNLAAYPKLVGGLDPLSSLAATEFYRKVLSFTPRSDLPRSNGVWDLGPLEAAELAKLAETTYRDVNIALANQFALFAHKRGLDVYSVIEACNSQPFSHIHQPGIAVGGHCIPVYPHFYMLGDQEARMVAEARKVNMDMPRRSIELMEASFGDLSGQTVAILGLAYRNGVREHALSGAWALRDGLVSLGARVQVHDFEFSEDELAALGLAPHKLEEGAFLYVIQNSDPRYRDFLKGVKPRPLRIFDGRNLLNGQAITNAQILSLGHGESSQGMHPPDLLGYSTH